MEIGIGIAAFIVAVWQLNLQRKETVRNGKINTLVHISTLLKDRISFHSEIIESLKAQKNQHWHGHARVINEELRPLLNQVNKDLLEITSDYKCSFEHSTIEKVLKLKSEE
ncbi:hypothetical protein ACMYR3_03030 [Ampullimonas aquatilis]|uniref:hypothetical protein n=1 Tax=Ampullimonas aquatilis TaxID=1341549 RepID=UPI003C76933A